eukprot:177828_1
MSLEILTKTQLLGCFALLIILGFNLLVIHHQINGTFAPDPLIVFPQIETEPNHQIDHDWIAARTLRNYYLDHVMSFCCEPPATKFKLSLIKLFKQKEISSVGIIDIGANKGQIFNFPWNVDIDSLYMLLIEPTPTLIPIIEKKAEEFKNKESVILMHVDILNLAVSNQATQNQTLIFRKNVRKNEISHLTNNLSLPEDEIWKNIPISVTTLDRLVSENTIISEMRTQNVQFKLLKIDTEGYDTLVLYGGSQHISFFDVVLYESHSVQSIEHGGPGTTVFGAVMFFEDLGFDLYKLGQFIDIPLTPKYYHPIHDDLKSMGWQNNVAINRKCAFYHEITQFLTVHLQETLQ